MTRREILAQTTAALFLQRSATRRYHISCGGYIFIQYAERQKKTLPEVLPEVIPMAHRAGFRNLEPSDVFFEPEIAEQTLRLVKSGDLRMPSVYVGGPLLGSKEAEATIAEAVRIGGLSQAFGCQAIVHNPNLKPQHQEKTDAELGEQSNNLNRMGRVLKSHGLELRVHNHTPEMVSGAREWRYTLQHTDPAYVTLCLDLDWVHQGDQDPLTLLKEAGRRVTEVHVRNSRSKLWLEDVSDGDVDYRPIARYFEQSGLTPLIQVELAYRENTVVTRSLEDDLRLSRLYVEKIFNAAPFSVPHGLNSQN